MKSVDLGTLGYRDAWKRQELEHARVLDGGEEVILYVEHNHTITTGRRAEAARSHVLATDGELERLGVDLVETDRGGDVTYHGPGQLVAYPIVRIADHGLTVGSYMRLLQEAVVATVADFGLEGQLDASAPGVWCFDDKIAEMAKVCAVGVRVKRGVTMHGLALNVEPDMHKFALIDPCGLGRPVTSLRRVTHAHSPSIAAVRPVLHRELALRLGKSAAGPQAVGP